MAANVRDVRGMLDELQKETYADYYTSQFVRNADSVMNADAIIIMFNIHCMPNKWNSKESGLKWSKK